MVQLIIQTGISCAALSVSDDISVEALKHCIEEEFFIPASQQHLYVGCEKLAYDDILLSDISLEEGTVVTIHMLGMGGGAKDSSRYKKASSAFRWKWKKKRTRRLQKKRRKMRMRAR